MKSILLNPGCSRRSFIAFSLMTFAMPACSAGGGGRASYGTRVKFSKGATLFYPDFDVKYTGTRKVSSPSYPRRFIYHDFEVSHGGTIKVVKWSSGTGDIGPAVFQFDGRKFWLELSRSDKLGKLAENEVVIWKE